MFVYSEMYALGWYFVASVYPPYLWHIFDQSDCQFYVGEIVEIIQPGDPFSYSKKKADEGKCPANQQQEHAHPGDFLTPPLPKRENRGQHTDRTEFVLQDNVHFHRSYVIIATTVMSYTPLYSEHTFFFLLNQLLFSST